MRPFEKLRIVLLVVAGTSLGWSCNGSGPTSLPPADCPTITGTKPDWGPVASQASSTNIDVELSHQYVADRIISSLAQDLPASATPQQLNIPAGQSGYIPKGGATITAPAMGLLTETSGSPAQHVLSLVLTPWLRKDTQNADGTVALSKAPFPYSFNLRLFLIPHLITPQTVPDLTKRQSLLQCGSDPTCSGVLLSVDLDSLSQGSEAIVCTTNPPNRNPSYNFVQQQVLQGIDDRLYGTASSPPIAPIVLPAKAVTSFVSGIEGAPINLTGIALGSDTDLKLGFQLDRGTPHAFDSFVVLSDYFAGNDWGIDLDTTFVSQAIQKRAVAAAQQNAVTLNVPITVDYQRKAGEGVISVSATGHAAARTCAPVSVSDTICTKICKDSQSFSTLMSCPQPPTVNVGFNACWFFYVIFSPGQGWANAQVCVGGPCPTSGCSALGDPIQFAAGPGDTFYATDVLTDEGATQLGGTPTFYLSGRSTLADLLHNRSDPRTSCASLSAACP